MSKSFIPTPGPFNDMAEKEWLAWRKVVELLADAGVVTDEDRKSPIDKNDTPGLVILNAIRTWGDLVSRLDRGDS